MNHSKIVLCLLLTLSVLSAGAARAQDSAGELAGLVLEDVNGEELRLSDYAGQDVLVISFWATYCKPCKTEMPFLQELHERYGGKGLKVVGISLDTPETESGVVPFLSKNNYTYTVAVDRQSDVTNVLNPKTTLPHLVIYDRTGRKVLAKDGFTPGDRPGLETKITKLLGEGGPGRGLPGSDLPPGGGTTAGELAGLVLEDTGGEELRLADHAGRDVLVISFWATYCKPCKTEMPFLQELHERYGGKGLKVVGISLDTPETESGVVPFLSKNNYTYTVAVDRQSDVTNVLNPKTTLPHLVIYDRAGRKVLAKDGFTPGDRPGLEAKITKLLAAEGPGRGLPGAGQAPPKRKGRIDWEGLARDFRYDITNSLYVEWHQGNHNTLLWDDDFLSIKDRLNVRLGTRGFMVGARFDGSHFIPVGDSDFPMDLGGKARELTDLYPHDYRVEKIYAKLRSSTAAVEVGDFYVCLGKGMTACIQKLDELAIDTTLRGAKGTIRTELFEATAFSGVSNIVNVGDQTQVKLPDPNDWLSGAALKTRFIPFVNVGVHGAFLKDDVDFQALPQDSIARKHLWSVGGIVEAPRFLWGHASAVSEFDWFHHDEVIYGTQFKNQGDDGFAWYTAVSGHVSIVGALVEVKWYEGLGGFGSMSKDVARDLGSYQAKSESIYYANLPPLEDEGLFLRPSFYDAVGFRGHLDVAVPGTGMIWVVNYAHHDEVNKGGHDFGKNDSWVRHVYGGVQLRYDTVGVTGNVVGGWRRDKENAESIHDYSMWHMEADTTFPIWGRLSAEISGRYESYMQVKGSFEPDFSIAQLGGTINVAPWLSFAYMYEYSDQPPAPEVQYQHHHAGAITYRFMSGSWLRVFFGSTRGGLKCSGGVCRVFPPFNGLKTELTVRF